MSDFEARRGTLTVARQRRRLQHPFAMKPTFFATPAAFRAWLQEHHASAGELLVGFHKVGSGRPSITWPQSVDQALCFGWIDGVRRSLGAESYTIRFTPRRARSIWSTINTRRFAVLKKQGLVQAAGLAAFGQRKAERSGVYSFEQPKEARLSPAQSKEFRAQAQAWAYFQSRPPWYRRTATFWVLSAKRAETRERRLRTLIADSAAGRLVGPLRRPEPKP
jgi:uncharacterized protein YdeI (YjbR/CyaY-like superfamily)